MDRSRPMVFGYEADKRHPLWDELDLVQSRRRISGGPTGSGSAQLKTHWLSDSSLAPQELSLNGGWFASQKPFVQGAASVEEAERAGDRMEVDSSEAWDEEDDLPDLEHTLEQAAAFGRRLALKTVMSTLREHQRRFPDKVRCPLGYLARKRLSLCRVFFLRFFIA